MRLCLRVCNRYDAPCRYCAQREQGLVQHSCAICTRQVIAMPAGKLQVVWARKAWAHGHRGTVPERPKGARWKRDGRSDAARGFDSLLFLQYMEGCPRGLWALFRKQMVARAARAFESLTFRHIQSIRPASSVWIRVPGYEPGGRPFESVAGRHFPASTRMVGRAVYCGGL